MLPYALLRVSVHLEGERIVPHYFTPRDEPWLSVLLDEFARFTGRRRVDWVERLREPLPVRAPKTKLRIALCVLEPLCRARPAAAVPPKEARAALFRAASASHAPRGAVLASVAASFAVSPVELDRALFADLAAERRVAAAPASFSAARLARDANLAIVVSLVRRASQVRITARGKYRALIGHARFVGLICRASRLGSAGEGIVLDVSGPFALFHHSELYGRALASLIPRLVNCDDFELSATCSLGGNSQLSALSLRSGDPLAAGGELALPERRLERKFERDFRRAAPDWELIREPAAIGSGEILIFPDYELAHRHRPDRRWLLEFVGFWTAEYLIEKLRRLRAAGIDNIVLCVDQRRECADSVLPADPRVIRYKTSIDAGAVLAVIAGEPRVK